MVTGMWSVKALAIVGCDKESFLVSTLEAWHDLCQNAVDVVVVSSQLSVKNISDTCKKVGDDEKDDRDTMKRARPRRSLPVRGRQSHREIGFAASAVRQRLWRGNNV